MNPNVKPKKPFGLSLACNIAADALKQSVAPASIILGNLLYLQKDTLFPKDLTTHFFSFQKKMAADSDKKIIATLLDELKRPQESVAATLEKYIAPAWVQKKITHPTPVANNVAKKTSTQKPKKKPVVKKVEPMVPVVIVKKSKLSI